MTTAPTGRTRLHPETRREQLLELGVRLLSTRSLDELSIDVLAEEAGISRGLLYHYFGNKQDFHRAVVRHAADDLIRVTAPVPQGEPLERLARSLDAYVSYDEAGAEGLLDVLHLQDTPAVRLMVRGWSAMAEDVVISWVREPGGVGREDLLTMLAAALPGVLSGTP
jgi:AcrR family transcriptional regulator